MNQVNHPSTKRMLCRLPPHIRHMSKTRILLAWRRADHLCTGLLVVELRRIGCDASVIRIHRRRYGETTYLAEITETSAIEVRVVEVTTDSVLGTTLRVLVGNRYHKGSYQTRLWRVARRSSNESERLWK